MNKVLPILLVVIIALGLIGGGGYYFFKKSTAPVVEEQTDLNSESDIAELALEQRPFVSLTPSADGHNLHLTVNKIPSNSTTVEYNLFYMNAQGVSQGATGSGKTNGSTSLERDVLLGSCSSGKCKYDEGVEKGTLEIKLRDSKGKLVAKTMSTPFHLMKAPTEVTLAESSSFSLKLDKANKADFFVAMQTIGIPTGLPGALSGGSYGVFSSAKSSVGGTVTIVGNGDIYLFSGSSWSKLTSGKTTKLGIFAKAS